MFKKKNKEKKTVRITVPGYRTAMYLEQIEVPEGLSDQEAWKIITAHEHDFSEDPIWLEDVGVDYDEAINQYNS